MGCRHLLCLDTRGLASTLPSSLTSLPGASSAGPPATGSMGTGVVGPTPGRRRAVSIRPGSTHHADRGSQYCSVEYQAGARKNGISISMSGKGNCFDNAMVETFFKTLKAETRLAHPLPEQDRSRKRNRPLHRQLLPQSRPPPFPARSTFIQPASVRRAGSIRPENALHFPKASPA